MLVDPIADLRSPGGSLISVFADRPSPGGFGALLADLVRPIKERSTHMDRSVQKSVRQDSERIQELAARFEAETAPSYAIFASGNDDVFVIEPLTHPTHNVATLGPRPYMRPLRAAPRGLRAGLVVADNALARTFVAFGGLVDEIGPRIGADVGKPNYGGFAGYDEHNVRAHASEASSKLWKEAGWRMLEEHLSRPFDYLAIGGHEQTLEEIAASLHPYLSRLPRTTFAANPNKVTIPVLRAEIQARDQEMRAQRQEALAGRVCDTVWSGGNAVMGLRPVLDAVNSQAVDTLVVAGSFQRDGVMCNGCGHLAREGQECPVCGAIMLAVDDVVAAAMDAAVSAGGSVYQLSVASPLDPEGVGALTRFPVSV